MRDYVISLEDEPEPVLYDLYAVSNHMGSLNGGHYTAFCKNAPTDQWLYFDDSRVSAVSAEKVKDTVCSASAYLLFYRKRGMDACEEQHTQKEMLD